MEGEGASILTDPDVLPVGSPEITDSHFVEVPHPSDEEHHSSQPVALTDDLRHKIIKQVLSSEKKKLCTVLVENLPEDHSTENIHKIFGEAGNIMNICICDPNVSREPKKCTIAEKLLSGKLHALVAYETVESAEKAVATLNDEQDWRYGMRVKLLMQRGKHVQRKTGWKGSGSENNGSVQASDPAGEEENHVSSEHHDDAPDEEDGEHLAKEKKVHRGRNRGRGRKQKYCGSNGQGHGTVSFSHHAGVTLKPPPGPRMPDGTRGFTMGRGRPLASDKN